MGQDLKALGNRSVPANGKPSCLQSEDADGDWLGRLHRGRDSKRTVDGTRTTPSTVARLAGRLPIYCLVIWMRNTAENSHQPQKGAEGARMQDLLQCNTSKSIISEKILLAAREHIDRKNWKPRNLCDLCVPSWLNRSVAAPPRWAPWAFLKGSVR